MKKALVFTLFPISVTGGGESYTLNCAKALSINNIECVLVAPENGDFLSDRTAQRFGRQFIQRKLIGGKVYNEKKIVFKDVLSELGFYDFILIHQYLAGIAIYDLMLLTHSQQKIIFTNLGFEENKEDFWLRYKRLPNHFFVEISNYAAQRTKKYTNNVNFVYAGVWKNKLEEKNNINYSDKNKFVSIGRILPHKSFEVVIDALNNNEEFVLIGPDGDKFYKEYLEMKSKSKNVYLIGEILSSEKDSIIAKSISLIANSSSKTYRNQKFEQSELLGLVILEALVNQTLPITSDQSALKEVMTVLKLSDFIYPERNSNYLKKLLKTIRNFSEEEYFNFVERSREIIRNEFLWDDYWLRIKEDVIES